MYSLIARLLALNFIMAHACSLQNSAAQAGYGTPTRPEKALVFSWVNATRCIGASIGAGFSVGRGMMSCVVGGVSTAACSTCRGVRGIIGAGLERDCEDVSDAADADLGAAAAAAAAVAAQPAEPAAPAHLAAPSGAGERHAALARVVGPSPAAPPADTRPPSASARSRAGDAPWRWASLLGSPAASVRCSGCAYS